MTKRQLIDEILEINRGTEAAFLAQFEDVELTEYLRHLVDMREPRRFEVEGVYEPVERVPSEPDPDRPPLFAEDDVSPVRESTPTAAAMFS